MFRLIRFTLSFVLSFAILSIPFGERPLFHHLHSWVSPYSGKMIEKTSSMIGDDVGKALKDGASKTKKFFTNSTPGATAVDKVESSLSATERKKNKDDVQVILDSHSDNITAEEEQMLKKVLEKEL